MNNRRSIMQYIKRLNAGIIAYREQLKLLEKVCRNPKIFTDSEIMTAKEGIEALNNKVDTLKSILKIRISYLLGRRHFAEGYINHDNGQFIVPVKSITQYPIEFLSTLDLRNGFIRLTEIRQDSEDKLDYSDLILDLNSGIVRYCDR